VKRRSLAPDLTVRHVRDRLGDKWTVPVIEALVHGRARFSELWQALEIAPKVLTDVLRSLERDGFISRLESGSAALQVWYELTSLGKSFYRLATTVECWAKGHEHIVAGARGQYTPPLRRNLVATQVHHSRAAITRDPTNPADGRAPRSGHAVVSHLSLAVRNIEKSARAYAEVLGIATPNIKDCFAGRGSRSDRIRFCWLRLPNFEIELMQPTTASSPYRDFIAEYDERIEHIGLDVTDRLEEKIHLLERIGGRRVTGSLDIPGYPYADIDLRKEIGTTIQLMGTRGGPQNQLSAPTASPSAHSGKLASGCVTHVGIVVRNAERSALRYSKVLRIANQHNRTGPSPHVTRVRSAHAKTVIIAQSGVAIEWIEPVGRLGPWRVHLENYGNSVHHIAFDVKDGLSKTIGHLERKGAEPVIGSGAGGHACLDLTRQLGLYVELNGTADKPLT
jgi:DNA-binding HxlR family transcriptional regulator